MRNHKRLLLALLPLAFFALCLLPNTALAQSGKYVFDENNTLTQDEFNQLETQGAQYADKYHTGVYLLFTNSMGPDEDSGSGKRDFARKYYESNKLGEGSGKEGILFVVATQSRKYVTIKHYDDKAKDPFSNDSVNDLESDAKSYLKKDKWYDAGNSYYEDVGVYLDCFARTGKQWTKPHTVTTIIKIAATILIPLMIALLVVRSEKNAMLTARMQTEAGNYLDSTSVNLRVSNDVFVNRTMSVVPIPKNDSSSSDSDSGWSDMGGGFSGSDGGDF